MKNHSANCGCRVIASIPDLSEVQMINNLCGFLLFPVGIGLTRDKVVKDRLIAPVIQLLSSLHLHYPPYIHGDARISNIVQTSDDSLLWIDLVAGHFPSVSNLELEFSLDMKTLIESILVDPTIEKSLLHEYSQNPLMIDNIITFIQKNI